MQHVTEQGGLPRSCEDGRVATVVHEAGSGNGIRAAIGGTRDALSSALRADQINEVMDAFNSGLLGLLRVDQGERRDAIATVVDNVGSVLDRFEVSTQERNRALGIVAQHADRLI